MPESTFGWLSIVPPMLAIALAIATRQVIISLTAGIWVGWVIHAGGQPLAGTASAIQTLIAVFAEAGQTRVIVFTMLMGSLLLLLQRGGGIDGFLQWVGRWKWSASRRGAQLMAAFIGLGVFIESTITVLVVGTVSRPLFDRLRISREKLAYICDSTSAPVCMLIPFNGWGATVLGILSVQAAAGTLGDRSPFGVFVAAIPLNFYALLAVALVFVVAASGWDFGPMKRAERRALEEGKLLADGAQPVVDEAAIFVPRKEGLPPRLANILVPLVGMIGMVAAGIAITGVMGVRAAALETPGLMDYLNQASGSTSVLWGVLFGLTLAAALLFSQRAVTPQEFVDLSFKGAGGMLPIATLLVLAFGIGMTCNALGTGPWVAEQVRPYLTPVLVAPLVFLVSCFIAFSTGTSWGTFAIMIPLAAPLVERFNAEGAAVSLPLVVSAVLGGGVFGDHCSPISDTTVVSSMASASDHIDHVRTQAPYALLAAAAALVLYVLAGVLAV
jgi:tetracycline resistance efflux pump